MKRGKIVIYIIASITCILLLLFKFNYDNDKAFSEIVTFIAINIGFCITALSIIPNSSFSKKLFDIQDSNNNSNTLLHTLVAKFINAIIVFIFTIGTIFFYSFIRDVAIKPIEFIGKSFLFKDLIKSIIWYLTILSFIKLISALRLLSKFIVRV